MISEGLLENVCRDSPNHFADPDPHAGSVLDKGLLESFLFEARLNGFCGFAGRIGTDLHAIQLVAASRLFGREHEGGEPFGLKRPGNCLGVRATARSRYLEHEVAGFSRLCRRAGGT